MPLPWTNGEEEEDDDDNDNDDVELVPEVLVFKVDVTEEVADTCNEVEATTASTRK